MSTHTLSVLVENKPGVLSIFSMAGTTSEGLLTRRPTQP